MPTPVKVLGILSIVLAVVTSSALAYTHEEVFQRTVPAAGVSQLSVSNVNGAISVQPWEKPPDRRGDGTLHPFVHADGEKDGHRVGETDGDQHQAFQAVVFGSLGAFPSRRFFGRAQDRLGVHSPLDGGDPLLVTEIPSPAVVSTQAHHDQDRDKFSGHL